MWSKLPNSNLFKFSEILKELRIRKEVIEWLLFNANSAISWWEQVNFQWDDEKVCFILDQHIRKGALKHGNYHFTFWSPFHKFSGKNLKINLPFSYSKPKETNKKQVFLFPVNWVFSEEKIYVYQLYQPLACQPNDHLSTVLLLLFCITKDIFL